jgi:hypothetical protein
LKEQHQINEQRKKQLLDVVDQQLQYDQYRQVLDNLDVQVEQSYLKRFVSHFTMDKDVFIYCDYRILEGSKVQEKEGTSV